MKIVVTSDTHIKENSKKRELPQELLDACRTAEMIIHAGDWQTPGVYEQLAQYAELKGVYGNVDGPDIRRFVPVKDIVEVEGWTIGIVHGHGEKQPTEKRASAAFTDEAVDMIIYGHSHIPRIHQEGKTLLLNPGSPTDKRRSPYYSFAIIEAGAALRCELVYFR